MKIKYNSEIRTFKDEKDLLEFMKAKGRQWFINFDPWRNDDREYDYEIGLLK